MPLANISYIAPTNIFTHTRKAFHRPDSSPSAEEKVEEAASVWMEGRCLKSRQVVKSHRQSQAFWFGAFSLAVSLSQLLINYWFETIKI